MKFSRGYNENNMYAGDELEFGSEFLVIALCWLAGPISHFACKIIESISFPLSLNLQFWYVSVWFNYQARRRGGSRGSNELPLVVNNGGLKTQTAGFQLLANSEGLENKL